MNKSKVQSRIKLTSVLTVLARFSIIMAYDDTSILAEIKHDKQNLVLILLALYYLEQTPGFVFDNFAN